MAAAVKPSPAVWAENVPAGMRALPQWVAHHHKKPEHPKSGGASSVTDPRTWGTFEQARESYARTLGDDKAGVGFVLTATSGLVFVDFDHVLEGGQLRSDLEPEVRALAEACAAASYAERSPSGTGLHALVIGKLPAGAAHNRRWNVGTDSEYGVEVYDQGRYCTVTGDRWGLKPLAAAPKVLERVVDLVGSGRPEAGPPEDPEPERLEEVMDALRHLDPDMPRPDWIKAGMALKAGLGEAGRDLWVGWSSEGSKHKAGEPDRLWDSFCRNGVGLGTILWMAEQSGWTRDGKYHEPEDVFSVVGEPNADEDGPFSLLDADVVTTRPVRWLWKFRMARGQVTVVAGDPKAGKTLMVEALAALRSRGKPLPGDATADGPKRWVLLETEDDENDTTVPRLIENGADLKMVSVLNRTRRVKLNDPEHLAHLVKLIRKKGDVEALVISPLNNCLGGKKLDINNDKDIRDSVMPLVELAKLLDIAVIVIMHLNKSGSGNPLYKVLGSIANVAIARTVLMVGRKEDQRYVTLAGSSSKEVRALAFDIDSSPNDENIGVLTWGEEAADVGPEDVIATPDAKALGARLEGAVAWLQHRLANGPVPAATMHTEGKAAGYSKRTLERARPKAGAVAVPPSHIGEPWVWKLAQAADVEGAR